MDGARTTITTSFAHMANVGACLEMNLRQSRLAHLKTLLTRPRKHVVVAVTETTITVEDQRMTWGEWFRALVNVFR